MISCLVLLLAFETDSLKLPNRFFCIGRCVIQNLVLAKVQGCFCQKFSRCLPSIISEHLSVEYVGALVLNFSLID